MCGIVGVVQGDETWEPVDLAVVTRELEAAQEAMRSGGVAQRLQTTASHVASADACVRGVRGVLALAHDPHVIPVYERLLDDIWTEAQAIEQRLDAGEIEAVGRELEQLNAAIVALKDAVWKVRRDAL